VPNIVKQILAIVGPILLLVISISIYARYSEGAGFEVLIAIAIGVLMFSAVLISLILARTARRIAQKAGIQLKERHPTFNLMLADFDKKSIRALRVNRSRLSEHLAPGLSILRVEADRVYVYRTANLELLGSLVVGLDLERFFATKVNRGNAFNEPCLRLCLVGGSFIDILLYEVSTGQWPSQESLTQLVSGSGLELN
jgi:hypothetical protein